MKLIDVVKWEGTPDVFAWKFPETNLSTKTQLIVHQTQEAVLFSKGKLLSKFGAGKHTLSTENIPVLRELYGIPFSGTNPFTAEVWFVNKVEVLDVKWGTSQPFQIRDPQFNLIIPVRAYGQFGISIADSEKFLLKLVGTLPEFNRKYIDGYFKGLLLAEATSAIAKKITDDRICIVDIAAHTITLSGHLCGMLRKKFGEYGISINSFYIHSISFPENDDTIVKLKAMMAKRTEMSMLGYTYQQERSFDVIEQAAKNTGTAGSVMGAGIGAGMGVGMGVGLGGAMSPLLQNVVAGATPQPVCKSCGQPVLPDTNFCPHCGYSEINSRGVAVPEIRCNKCGSVIPPEAKFCDNCGDEYYKCPYCQADIDPSVSICPVCHKELPCLCAKCGAVVPENAKFCSQCGTSVLKSCRCGAKNNPRAKFCVTCGTKLDSSI